MRKPHAAYSGERKSFCLRKAKKPIETYPLSGVVLCIGVGGVPVSRAYIRFSFRLVEAVGGALPYGVGSHNPAYLRVIELQEGSLWRIMAAYIDGTAEVVLWETSNKPAWIG